VPVGTDIGGNDAIVVIPQSAADAVASVSGLVAVLLLLIGVGAVMAMGRVPRCRRCGHRATVTEEYEASERPRLLAVAYRCPACKDLVTRRTVDVPCQ